MFQPNWIQITENILEIYSSYKMARKEKIKRNIN